MEIRIIIHHLFLNGHETMFSLLMYDIICADDMHAILYEL